MYKFVLHRIQKRFANSRITAQVVAPRFKPTRFHPPNCRYTNHKNSWIHPLAQLFHPTYLGNLPLLTLLVD